MIETPTENVKKQIAALERMTVGQLQKRYAEIFGEPARSGNRPSGFCAAWRGGFRRPPTATWQRGRLSAHASGHGNWGEGDVPVITGFRVIQRRAGTARNCYHLPHAACRVSGKPNSGPSPRHDH